MDSNTKQSLSTHIKNLLKFKDLNNNLVDLKEFINPASIEKRQELINYCDILINYIYEQQKKEINNFKLP